LSRTNVLFAGKTLFLVGALVATFVAMRWDRDPDAAIGDPLSSSPHARRGGPVTQLPAIVARAEPGGIFVSLRNDTEDQQVFLDPAWDHLVIEYSRASQGEAARVVHVPGRTLGPGEETQAVFVPLDERAGPAKVEFVSTQHTANTRLVAKTAVAVP
jgi:hypothetical protein